MKIRINFVTNSSSSNFILAHNGEFTEKQKNAVMEYICNNIGVYAKMKIRIDFVTNSSSSSFILARKGEITEEQKNAVMDYIVKKMLGEKILAYEEVKDVKTEAAMEEKVAKLAETDYWVGELQDEIKEALRSGKDIYFGKVDHEQADWHYCNLFEDIWGILKKTGNGNFEAIHDDLSY